jgi:hypothetical protein
VQRHVLLWIVIVIGVVNFIAQFIPELRYSPDPIITGAFMTIAGFLLTGKNIFDKFIASRKEETDKEKEPKV